MKKAILVIDRPERCGECQLNEERELINKKVYVCNAYGLLVYPDELLEIPDWCPLKPMPEKWPPQINGLTSDQQTENWYFAQGWNTCLAKITDKTKQHI